MDNSPTWGFRDARAGGELEGVEGEGQVGESSSSPSSRLRVSRHRQSSLPRALFGPGRTSIFGSGRADSMEDAAGGEEPSQRQQAERPPLLSLQPPSQEQIELGRAALSTPSQSSHTPPVNPLLRRSAAHVGPSRLLPEVEKEADDPTAAPASSSSRAAIDRQQSTTHTTLTRLFTVNAPKSPEASRHNSYLDTHRPSFYERNVPANHAPSLPNHIYTRGLLAGKHSDITLNAFGQKYRLHRIVLDQAPFFTSALSPPWLEAESKEMSVHPDDLDPSITQTSFELALKRLYGASVPQEEDAEAVGLFATACWLEMQDLIDDSIGSMLRQMTPETISPLIKLVTGNYYGRAGDKILASAKAMLCRDGWSMPLRNWDGIPGDIVREIVGGDGFFIDGELDRWILAKKILDRRLRARATEAGLVEKGSRRRVRKAPDTANLMAVRFDGVYRKNSGGARGMPDALQPWITPYTHPDVEPILVLLDEGIHYIHLDFEQLQFIRGARDILGLPVMPEKVISNALWQQVELRQKVMNAREADEELDLSVRCTAEDDEGTVSGGNGRRDTTMSITTPSEPRPNTSDKGKHRQLDVPVLEQQIEEDMESGSWDGNGKPRKFWIPGSDCNIVMGGRDEPVIATSNNSPSQRHATRLSATIQPEDIQWAADFAAMTTSSGPRPQTSSDIARPLSDPIDTTAEIRYTHFPPFRFAAEFPNPRLLKERKRVYSRTVFYAGSLWNIYIQKVVSARNRQLGVYLHRAKERDVDDVLGGGSVGVDQRIGTLEREILGGGRGGGRRSRGLRHRPVSGEGEESEGSWNGGDADAAGGAGEGSAMGIPRSRNLLERRGRRLRAARKEAGVVDPASHLTGENTSLLTADTNPESDFDDDDDDDDDDEDEDNDREYLDADAFAADDPQDRSFPTHSPLTHPTLPRRQPTLPPYTDARPTIKTYFKIYSPSRGGRMLSVYESAPDKFNFSQSWGWKSSTLMLLDEGLMGDDGREGDGSGSGDAAGSGVGAGGNGSGGGNGRQVSDGRLRFMVVIGNI
ncbi:hypothetical protein LTR62_003463 [Meristemomyces frigidus]|uniref:BTB domain-containing protein n=1 Tax=Meristemomyces frigidus TaxID=1508187 RepID=A0AAN7YGV8_9PEZI|nr:hypothetical protein LTR62_003463 [Meristemomyces frigidus]